MTKELKRFLIILIFGIVITLPNYLYAHPGRTDSSGGHTCRTNCGDWGLSYGEYHYHNGGGSTYTPPVVVEPKIEYKTETKTEEVPFETKNEDDQTLEEGKTTIKQEGKNGTKTITYEVTYTDGSETAREKTNEEITIKPTDKVVLNGVKKLEGETQSQTKSSGSDAFFGWLLILGLGYGGYVLFKKSKKSKNDKTNKQ